MKGIMCMSSFLEPVLFNKFTNLTTSVEEQIEIFKNLSRATAEKPVIRDCIQNFQILTESPIFERSVALKKFNNFCYGTDPNPNKILNDLTYLFDLSSEEQDYLLYEHKAQLKKSIEKLQQVDRQALIDLFNTITSDDTSQPKSYTLLYFAYLTIKNIEKKTLDAILKDLPSKLADNPELNYAAGILYYLIEPKDSKWGEFSKNAECYLTKAAKKNAYALLALGDLYKRYHPNSHHVEIQYIISSHSFNNSSASVKLANFYQSNNNYKNVSYYKEKLSKQNSGIGNTYLALKNMEEKYHQFAQRDFIAAFKKKNFDSMEEFVSNLLVYLSNLINRQASDDIKKIIYYIKKYHDLIKNTKEYNHCVTKLEEFCQNNQWEYDLIWFKNSNWQNFKNIKSVEELDEFIKKTNLKSDLFLANAICEPTSKELKAFILKLFFSNFDPTVQTPNSNKVTKTLIQFLNDPMQDKEDLDLLEKIVKFIYNTPNKKNEIFIKTVQTLIEKLFGLYYPFIENPKNDETEKKQAYVKAYQRIEPFIPYFKTSRLTYRSTWIDKNTYDQFSGKGPTSVPSFLQERKKTAKRFQKELLQKSPQAKKQKTEE